MAACPDRGIIATGQTRPLNPFRFSCIRRDRQPWQAINAVLVLLDLIGLDRGAALLVGPGDQLRAVLDEFVARHAKPQESAIRSSSMTMIDRVLV